MQLATANAYFGFNYRTLSELIFCCSQKGQSPRLAFFYAF